MSDELKMSWAQVLGVVQQIAPTPGWSFTTSDLEQAGIEKKEAARWLTKFVDWGYIGRGDFEAASSGAGRPRRFYHMLKRGLEKDVTTIGRSDFDRLMDAVQELQDARGENAEKAALRNLFRIKDVLLEEREKRLKGKPSGPRTD